MSLDFDKIVRDKMEGLNTPPPADLWSRIESGIGEGASNQAFDKTVKAKLSPLQSNPPKAIWRRIATSMGYQTPFYKKAIFRWSAASIILLVTSFGIWHYQSNFSHNISNLNVPKNTRLKIEGKHILQKQNLESAGIYTNALEHSNSTISKSKTKTEAQSKSTYIEKETSIAQNISTEISEKQTYSQEDAKQNNHRIIDLEIENPVNVLANKIAKDSTDHEIVDITKETEDENSDKSPILVQNPIQKPETPNENIKKENQPTEPDNKIAQNENPETNLPSSPKDGIEAGKLPRNPRNINKYGIELAANLHHFQGESNVLQKGFQLGFSYQNLNFIADLGIGMAFSSDKQVYQMEYDRYEYVKSQYIVDSLGYVFDANTQSFKPVPYGHQEDVYDDVAYSYSDEAILKYVYLSIPFNFGYIKSYKHYNLFAKAGIQYQTVISKRIVNMLELDDNSKLKTLYFPSKAISSPSISYSLSLGGNLKLTDDWMLSASSIFIYNQNPLYVSDSKRPWGVGLKLGLMYNL